VLKKDIQTFLRNWRWHLHFGLDAATVMPHLDSELTGSLNRLNFRLCKRFLHRKFSEDPVDRRIHSVALFQGTRAARTRHLHVLIHIPPHIDWNANFARRVRQAVQTEWLGVRPPKAPPFAWCNSLPEGADSNAAATYVSRHLNSALWEGDEVYFSP